MSRLQLNDSDLLRQQALFNGRWQDAHQGAMLPVTDPATGETLATIPALGRAETEQAIAYASAGAKPPMPAVPRCWKSGIN
jgi:succinate-semialdehyde dehydrogenase/glutarate-semialdehyde dehydrogenase